MANRTGFAWDEAKNLRNQAKHGVSFEEARTAFMDHHRVILRDDAHSEEEERYYCLGRAGEGILTVRFTYAEHTIRIIGAGYWRKGKKIYETENTR